MEKQQRIVGAIIKIDLGDGYHTYGRILERASFAFYDVRTKENLSLEEIISRPILFIVAAYNDVVTKGRWKKVGRLPLEDKLKNLPMEFVQDQINPLEFRIYDPNTGEMKPSTRDECEGLECAAVWEAEHVEDRIRDYYEGRTNRWVESLKIR